LSRGWADGSSKGTSSTSFDSVWMRGLKRLGGAVRMRRSACRFSEACGQRSSMPTNSHLPEKVTIGTRRVSFGRTGRRIRNDRYRVARVHGDSACGRGNAAPRNR
jgi:hypothetical protein